MEYAHYTYLWEFKRTKCQVKIPFICNMQLFIVVKSIPVRCVIEIRSGDTCADGGVCQPETETFAIVPSNSLFRDVVKTVLLKLGYSIHEAITAKGRLVSIA